MPTLHLIRHARPMIDPSRPSATWGLAPGALDEISRLRSSGVLPTRATWFSSPYPKALMTARAASSTAVSSATPSSEGGSSEVSIEVVDDLREMDEGGSLVLPDAAWPAVPIASMTLLDVPAHPGWETGRACMARLTAAVERICLSHPGEDLVLAGHGRAFTLLVASLTSTAPDVGAWSTLLMPDHCALSLSGSPLPGSSLPGSSLSGRVISPWGAWAGPTAGEPTS